MFFFIIKAETGKKRPVDSATKTPVPEKKAKLVAQSGQKSGYFGNSIDDKPKKRKKKR